MILGGTAMKYYHGEGRKGPYFEGWYLKYQTKDGKSLTLIPAIHMDGTKQRRISLQILTDHDSWCLEYPESEFYSAAHQFHIRMGRNIFDEKGIQLHVEHEGISLQGTLQHGPFAPLKSDIMGPFQLLGRMECAHGVISMGHSLCGTLTLNGKAIDFTGGIGYVETDRGCSFPRAYLWTQCSWQKPEDGSLMLSVATIPLLTGHFTGCICAIMYQGQEYRLATYRGVRVERWSGTGAEIQQGKLRLTVEVLEGQGQPLRAPVAGAMERTVFESLQAKLRYRFWCGKDLLFQRTDNNASFEYADERATAGNK